MRGAVRPTGQARSSTVGERVVGTSWRAGDRVGRFVLAEHVGSGAFAEVWRARDPRGGEDVAVKILKPDPASRDEHRAAVVREARALARLSERRHVVDVYEYDVSGPVYVVMQLVHGPTLSAMLAENARQGGGGFGARRSVALVDQIAAGVEAAHQVNLVHLDLTPRNVAVGPGDEVYLVDFGLVGAVNDEMLAGSVIRGEGVGTARYMAPERLGRSLVAPAFGFDVYALGCLLYECLTGQAAFARRSVRKIKRASRRARRPRPSDVDPTTRAFDALVVDSLAVDPDDRPASVAEFRARLREAAAGAL